MPPQGTFQGSARLVFWRARSPTSLAEGVVAMKVGIVCQGCGARYEIDAQYAGRSGTCKQCGMKFVVPAPAQPGGPAGVATPPPPPMPMRGAATNSAAPPPRPAPRLAPQAMSEGDLDDTRIGEPAEDDLLALAPKVEREETVHEDDSGPIVPTIVTDALLPLLLILAGLGWAGYIVVTRALASQNPTLAFIFTGLAVALYFLAVVPMSFNAIESAARTAEVELSDSVWLQTFSILSVPTAALVIGWFHGGVSGLILGGVIGLVAMYALVLLMFR